MAELEAVAELLLAVREPSSLLFAVAGLLLLIQPGELEVELVFKIFIRGSLGLSLLDVDSERLNGSDARRNDGICSGTFDDENAGSE